MSVTGRPPLKPNSCFKNRRIQRIFVIRHRQGHSRCDQRRLARSINPILHRHKKYGLPLKDLLDVSAHAFRTMTCSYSPTMKHAERRVTAGSARKSFEMSTGRPGGWVTLCLINLALIAMTGCRRSTHAASSPPVVEVVQVETRDVPVHGEWIGTL